MSQEDQNGAVFIVDIWATEPKFWAFVRWAKGPNKRAVRSLLTEGRYDDTSW